MQSSNGNFGTVNFPLRGDGLNHRKMDNQERLSFGVDLWVGEIPLNHFTLDQVCALLPGVTKTALYRAVRARRNGGNHAENDNGDGSNPPSPATLAADLIETVGFDTALDLLVAVSNDGNGNGGGGGNGAVTA
jgi:hypothetical protein